MSKRFTIEDALRFQAAGLKVSGLTQEPSKIIPAPQSAKEKHQALGRMKKGQMNKTEERYASVLEGRKLAGEVLQYWFEAIKLRIGDDCFFEPDFMVLLSNFELEIHEVKGGWITDDGLVKFRAAQTLFPFRFRMMVYKEKVWSEKK